MKRNWTWRPRVIDWWNYLFGERTWPSYYIEIEFGRKGEDEAVRSRSTLRK